MLIRSALGVADKRRIQEMLFANNGGDLRQQLLDGSLVFLPLTHSLVLQRGTGSPTFTRASTATVTNNDGYLVTALAGEARFVGARRVRNLLPSSEDLTSGWAGTGSTLAAGSITENGATSGHYTQTTSMVIPSSVVFIMHAEVKQSVGTRNVGIGTNSVGNAIFNPSTGVFVANDGVTLSHGTGEQTADGYWPVWVAVHATASNNPIISLYSGSTQSYAGDGTSQVLVRKIMIEDITGRADQTTPSEYVSVGVYDSFGTTNLLTVADVADFNSSGWTRVGLTASGNTVTFASNNDELYCGATGPTANSFPPITGNTYAVQFTVSATAAINGAVFEIVDGGDGVPSFSTAVNVTTTPTPITLVFVMTSNMGAIAPRLWMNRGHAMAGAAGQTMTIANLRYVDVSAYHGSMVDGVKCFNTDRDGAVIPAATNTGYLAEGARTQILATADIRDMTTAAWILGATMTRARTSIGADGAANSATRLTGGAVAATNTCYTTITAAASSRTYSALVKRVTGTGPVRIVQTGTETDISTQLNTTGYALVQLNASILNAVMGFKIDTNGDAIDVDFNQFEAGASASSRIASAVTRAADQLTYPSAGNISGAVGAAYCEIKTGSACGRSLSFNAGGTGMIDAGTGDSLSFRAYDETNVVNVTAGDSSASTVKQAIAWGGSTLSAARNGTTASGSFDGNMSPTGISIGGTTGGELNGTIRNVRIWSRQLSASEMQAITA